MDFSDGKQYVMEVIYGIFYERNRHFEGTGYRAGHWPWRVGRYQLA